MTTITSAHLTVAAGPGPGSVGIGVHGALGVAAMASLQRVLDGILEDREILSISIDLHDVRGVDLDGVAGLAAVAEGAERSGADLTLNDPPELLCEALESEGLTGLVRMGHRDPRPRWAPGSDIDRRRARSHHPAGQLLLLEEPDTGQA